jgi:nicotinic acid phosphoribosyltransferase
MMDEEVKRAGFTIFGNKKDFLKISNTFSWLKMVTSIPKKYLYFQALKWISEDSIAQQKFLQYLEKKRFNQNY